MMSSVAGEGGAGTAALSSGAESPSETAKKYPSSGQHEASSAAEDQFFPLTSHCVKALGSKEMDKRKAAAVEIEK